MKTILALIALIITLSACNSSEKIQLRAPQNDLTDTKNSAVSDTAKLDSVRLSIKN